ncbi:MAG TPA: hypothetical protein VIJ79_06065 [Acidobacteriaceae bacterium]
MTHQGKKPGSDRCIVGAISVLCLALFGAAVGSVTARAQPQANPPGTTSAPVVDSSTPGPTTPPANPPTTDAATESSPVAKAPHGVSLPAHAVVAVRLLKAIDSAHVRNGDMLDATLAAPVRTSDGRTLSAGTRVGVTVLAVAAAGKISSRGEITLQVVRVGPAATITDALTFRGQLGHKDLPDSAPAKGTEATLPTNTTLRFHVAPVPK